MYSALKRNGECLYDIARRGEVVERQPRPVTIHELTIRDFDGTSFTMDCLVSKGTPSGCLPKTSAESSAPART